MMVFLWILVLCVALYSLDRFLLWLESRGFIYYRKSHSSPGTAASAFLEIHSLLESNRKQLVEVMRTEQNEQSQTGDPPGEDQDPTLL
jgi:hypothetical protein